MNKKNSKIITKNLDKNIDQLPKKKNIFHQFWNGEIDFIVIFLIMVIILALISSIPAKLYSTTLTIIIAFFLPFILLPVGRSRKNLRNKHRFFRILANIIMIILWASYIIFLFATSIWISIKIMSFKAAAGHPICEGIFSW